MHCERTYDANEGFEILWPGPAPYSSELHAGIQDWISYGHVLGRADPNRVPAEYIDLWQSIQGNRDRHYASKQMQSIEELLPVTNGKTFLILCPGPSLVDTLRDGALDLPDDVVVLSINHACRLGASEKNPHFAFIMERRARWDWIEREGAPVPGIPDQMRLITCPDASGWLTDVWPDKHRFYANVLWDTVPRDHRERFPLLNNLYISPVAALDTARVLGASKVVFLGADFAMDCEGNYYWDMRVDKHPSFGEHARGHVMKGLTGQLCKVSPWLWFYRNVLEACCYWTERTARIPCINATDGGIFDWRPMSLREALNERHRACVDFVTGEVGSDVRGRRVAPSPLYREVA